MLITLEECKQYLHVDYCDDDVYINELIQSAEDYLIDSIDDYEMKISNDRFRRKARLCSFAIIQECHDNRIFITDKNEKIKYIISSFLIQMQYCNYE